MTEINLDESSNDGLTHSRFASTSNEANKIELSWHNISVFTKPSKRKWNLFSKTKTDGEDKCILNDVNGKVDPGQLLAIMGASGAGKTTFMNVLTGRNLKNLIVTGEVKANGVTVGKSLRGCSSYIQQNDTFFRTITVREHLIFQAMLRMDSHLSYKEKLVKVKTVISQFGLTKCADTLIGGIGAEKGISGGERKRLAFATEVLTNPAVMFCDEPTSGLDFFMSMNVVSVLKKLAVGGCTIICTIHQPSSEIYELFDNILLMAEGRVAFMGHREDAIPFFEKLDLRLPQNYSPADFFILSLAVKPGEVEECRNKINMICEEFSKSYKEQSSMECARQNSLQLKAEGTLAEDTSRYKATWFMQVRAVLWRSFLTTLRDPRLFGFQFIHSIIISILLGIIYLNQKLDQPGIMNINGAMFCILTNMTFVTISSVTAVFCNELPIFMKEHANSMYRVDVYFICKTMTEMPFYISLPIVFTSILYWMAGLKPEISAFFICLVTVVLVVNIAASFGYMVSCATNSGAMAQSVGISFMIPFMLFGGFFINNTSPSPYIGWIKYLSWYFYAFEIITINQWRNVYNITCPPSGPCLSNGDAVLETFHFKESKLNRNFFMLLLLFLGYRMMAFIFLFIRSSKRKSNV